MYEDAAQPWPVADVAVSCRAQEISKFELRLRVVCRKIPDGFLNFLDCSAGVFGHSNDSVRLRR